MAVAIANGGQEEVFMHVPGQNQKNNPGTSNAGQGEVFLQDPGQNQKNTPGTSNAEQEDFPEDFPDIGPECSSTGQEEDSMQEDVGQVESPAAKKIKINVEDDYEALTQGVTSNVTDAHELFLLREQQLAAARMRAFLSKKQKQ